jgi:DNA-binding CsgD family transcriptional regulator/tetratricopeptide (TPR) repeat protein
LPSGGHSGDDGSVEGAVQPLHGRASELRALESAIAADRSVALTGEAGIGKTALARAAVIRQGRVLREGGGLATLLETPYLALRRALHVAFEGDPAEVAARVEALVGPDALFLDDLQWIDAASRDVLDLLAARLLVVTAIRADDPNASGALEAVRRLGLEVMTLEPLDAVAAAAIVRDRRPDLEPGQTAEVVRQAAGNPLVLEELAAGGPSPMTSRNLAARVNRLAGDARRAVELLAVADQPLPARAIGPGLGEASGAGLVVERAGLVEIRHELVGDAVREALDASRRRELHRQAADVVAEAGPRARHLAAAGLGEEAAAAAREALAEHADPRERAALLEVLADVGPPDRRLALRLEAARVLDELSEWPAVARLLTNEIGGSAEDQVERQAILAHARFATGDAEAARALLEASARVEIPVESGAAARRSIETATFLVNMEGSIDVALRGIEAALAAAPSATSPRRDLEVLRASILLLATGSGDPALIQAGFAEAFAQGRFRTATDRARVIQYLLLMGAGSDQALGFLLDMTGRFEAAGVGSVALEFKADAVLAALLAGHLAQAVELADELLERPAPLRARQGAEIHRARALAMLGHLDDAEADLTRLRLTVSPDWFGRGELLNASAELALWSGRPAEALRAIDAALAVPAPVAITHVAPSVLRAMIRAELGDDPGAAPAGAFSPSLAGAIPEFEAHGHLARGELDLAIQAFDRAAAGWARFNEPRAVLSSWAAGEVVRRARRVPEALERLRAALERSTTMGFEALTIRIRRSLRQAGARTSGSASPGAARGGPFAGGLTVRERELVSLVERGLTNIEIARRLGLGRPTVARILASAMTKLGVETRAQLAALVDA